jgi:hypothetical protein
MLIIGGLLSAKLWTKAQVDRLVAQHIAAMARADAQHASSLAIAKDQYTSALAANGDAWRMAHADAVRREGEWRSIATDWQKVATMLGETIEPMHEQSATVLTIVKELQSAQARRGNR